MQPLQDDECWVWFGLLDKSGYGIFKTEFTASAHRFSYELHKGRIPDGLHVLHTCNNPPCVNPSHLKIGTNKDNIADKIAAGNHKHSEETRKTLLELLKKRTFSNEWKERLTQSRRRLQDGEVWLICLLFSHDIPQQMIAKMFMRSRNSISRITRGVSYSMMNRGDL